MKFHLIHASPLAALLLALGTPSGAGDGPPVFPVDVKAAAARIDRLLEADMQRAGVVGNPLADDATFVRRVYLGLVGRIPTAAETEAFLRSQATDKRANLIDTLLAAPGHASRLFSYWADLLRVKSRLGNQVSGEPFIHFLKESIEKGLPYDELVAAMVTASGPAHARDNGATGMLLRDRGMPLDSMANTVRVFLGTRLECAQCHNHPFDKWKQKDFFEMAAFTGGLEYRTAPGASPMADAARTVLEELRREQDRAGQRAFGRMMRPVAAGISGSGTGVARLPKDYAYDDATANQLVTAHAIFGQTPKLDQPAAEDGKRKRSTWRERQAARRRNAAPERRRRNGGAPEIGSRAAFADWLTAPDNPRFTKTIANRMWKFVMGRGLIEPVDNLMDDTVASNPALMTELERLMQDVDYDLRAFLRVLYNTQAAQRLATTEDVPDDQKYYFQGPLLRRMTAEQVWDSMLTFVVPDVDASLRPPGQRAEFVYRTYEDFVGMNPDQLREEIDRQKLRYSDPQKFRAMMAAERRAEMRARQAEMETARTRSRPLLRALRKARREKDTAKVEAVTAQLRELGIDPDRPRAAAPRRLRDRLTLVRASDLPSPAPDGHFLRQFGQSDREQIESSHTEANVPQVLSLLNGFLEKEVLADPSTALMRTLASQPSDAARVRAAYLAVLNREPRGRELAAWESDFAQIGAGVVGDLLWTLVNSHEFRFIQ